MNNDLKFMKLAYEEALKCLNLDEVPVGAIIVKDDEIIACGHNLRENSHQATAHAEIIAINQACEKLQSWYLDECTLYVTLEPCIMCTGAIINSRIKKVVFGAYESRWLALTTIYECQYPVNHHPEIIGGILENDCSQIIKNYFKEKRKNKENK